jgi:AraC-like DNA-binding protein
MKQASAWAIHHPVTPVVLFVVLFFMGVVAFIRLPINLTPDVSYPVVNVTVVQPGAAPTEIETQIVQKVEGAVANVGNVKRITSVAMEGQAWLNIEFQIGTPIDRAVTDVRDSISKVRSDLPEGIEEPQVTRFDVEGGAIAYYAVSTTNLSEEEISWFVDNTVSKRLLTVPGVAQVQRSGGVSREIRVELDPARMQALGITAISAPTVRDAVDVAARYSRLLTDSFLIWFEAWRNQGVIHLSDQGPSWTRPAADFAMAAFYKIHLSDEVPAASHLECWFPYEMPEDMSEYQRSFPNITLKFNAPFFAFAFNRAYEKAPMPGADSVLHAVHCERVDSLLADLSAARALKTRVRRLIEQEIQYTRGATVPRVARALRMSRRTMSRRLEREGTSFAEELDNARRQLALVYVNDGETPLKEVAFRLGFSHAESFHRAFKRWTGETPLTYRKRTPEEEGSERPTLPSPAF